nr:PREDICTED: putative protein TPRXL [Bemisia tabaci]
MGVENEKSVRVDEFEVRYADCEYPTVNGVDGITTSPKSEWVGSLTSLLLRATSTPSLGSSYSIQSSSRSSSRPTSRSSSLLSRPSSSSSSLSSISSSSSSLLSRPSSKSSSRSSLRSSKSSSSLSSRSSSRSSPVLSFGGSSKSWAKDLDSYLASLSP